MASSRSINTKPLFPNKIPETINFSESIPSSRDFKVCQLTPQQLLEKIPNMQSWCETILVNEDAKENELNLDTQRKLNWYLQAARNNLSNLVLCRMQNEVGYGVFALKEIPEKEYISFYAGQLLDSNPLDNKDNPYFFSVGEKTEVVDAKGHGNISRFIQHLPMPENYKVELDEIGQDDYQLGNVIKDQVATANVTQREKIFQHIRLVCFVTTCRVKQFEQLGFDYGFNYWSAHITPPFLFNKLGEVIDPSLYFPKKRMLIVNDIEHKILEIKKIEDELKENDELIINFDQKDESCVINKTSYRRASSKAHSGVFSLVFNDLPTCRLNASGVNFFRNSQDPRRQKIADENLPARKMRCMDDLVETKKIRKRSGSM